LCDIKLDESQWNEHLISTEHLQKCKEKKEGIVAPFFNIIFKTYHKRKDIYDLKDEHTLDFWQSYFETKVPKEKFDVLCTTNNISELEASLTSDLLYFINNCTYDIGETFLDSLDKIIICRICNDEVHKSLLYDHITSEKHRRIENYFIRKCMTYCDKCNIEVKNDEWREHIISYDHTFRYGEKYCNICKKNFTIVAESVFHPYQDKFNHLKSDLHKKNEER